MKENTSNTNLKPLKLGKDKCEYTRERLDAYKPGIARRRAKFVLHPILTQILEQMETFCMGKTLLLREENDPDGNGNGEDDYDGVTDTFEDVRMGRGQSTKYLKSTSLRSNSANVIDLQNKMQTPSASRKSPTANITRAASKLSISKQISRTESTVEGGNLVEEKERQSKLITKRSKTSTHDTIIRRENSNEQYAGEDRYRAIAGLRATMTDRSVSAPFLKLTVKDRSAFVESKMEHTSPLQIKHKYTLYTKKHTSCCYITGITALSNGNIVLCDSVHDSLQLYDPEIKCISEICCPHPWGIASISDTAIAVSLHYDHKITLVQAAKSLERLQDKDIVLKCKASLVYDITYYAYRIYALCIDSDVHILDLKGTEYGIIRTGIAKNTLKYLDVDIDKERVVVSGEDCIACLDFKGLLQWSYKPQSKAKLVSTGVLVYKGCLLVGDWENNRLVEIYDGGQKMRTVYSDRIEKPVAMCLSESGGDIFVTQGDYEFSEEKARVVQILQVEMEEK